MVAQKSIVGFKTLKFLCPCVLDQYLTQLNSVSWCWTIRFLLSSLKEEYKQWSKQYAAVVQRCIASHMYWLFPDVTLLSFFLSLSLLYLLLCASRSNWSCEETLKPRGAPAWTAPRSPAWSSWLRSSWARGSALWSTWREAWSLWSSRRRPCLCLAASSSPSSSDMWNDTAYIKKVFLSYCFIK